MIPHATPVNPEENADSEQGAAQGAAVGAGNSPFDPELGRLIEAWPKLPAAIRSRIMATVNVETTATE